MDRSANKDGNNIADGYVPHRTNPVVVHSENRNKLRREAYVVHEVLIKSAITDVGSLAGVSGDLRPTRAAPNHLMSPRCRGGEVARVALRTFTGTLKAERHKQYVTRAVEAVINMLTHFMGYFYVSNGGRSRVVLADPLLAAHFFRSRFY